MDQTQHNRIRIAFLMDFPVPYREGTFERFTDVGLDLTVYYAARRVPGRDWVIDPGAYRQVFLPGWSIGAWFYFNPTIIRELWRGRYQVVVIYGYSYLTALLALITAKLRRIPVVMRSESTLYDHTNRNRGPLFGKIKRIILKPILRICDACAPSGTAAQEYLQHYGVPGHKCFIVPTACDVESFKVRSQATRSRRAEVRRDLGIAPSDTVFLYSGRLIRLKQVDKLIRAFRMLRSDFPNAALVIVGDGEERESLQILAGADSKIYFVGFQNQEQLPVYYGIADVFVFPSQGDVWGVVINEAMACGLPVISNSSVGAVPDMVKDGVNGYITKGSEPSELLEAMVQFMVAPGRSAEMGSQASETVCAWNHDAAASAFRKVIDVVLGGAYDET